MKDIDLTPFKFESVVFFVNHYDEFLEICKKYPGQSRGEGGKWAVCEDSHPHAWIIKNVKRSFDIIVILDTYKYPEEINDAFSDFTEIELC